MKSLKKIINKRGLNARLIRSLLLAGVICVAFYFIVSFAAGEALSYYFNHSDFEKKHVDKQAASLQQYIDRENISSKDLDKLKQWEKKQPLIFLELYSEGKCIYATPEQATDAMAIDYVEEENAEESYLREIRLKDMEVDALLYSDFYYQYYYIVTIVAFVAAFILFILLFLRSVRQLIRYVCRLTEDMQILEGGELDHEVEVRGNDELTDLAESMNHMRLSFKSQMEQEQALYQNNRRMITQMSHDLRTPLTGLMLYTDIARQHKYRDEADLQECLTKIDEKAQSIKERSDHIFEYALSDMDAGQQEADAADVDGAAQTLTCEEACGGWIGKLTQELADAGFTVDRDTQWPAAHMRVRPELLERIRDNIVSNIVKYADPEQEIFIKTVNSDAECGLFFANACRAGAQTADSYGIGLDSIREMMARMDGACRVQQSEDRFELTLLFPVTANTGDIYG